MFAAHTRTWEDVSSEGDDDFFMASHANATINASVRAYRFRLHQQDDEVHEVVLTMHCDWRELCTCVQRDLHMFEDMSHEWGGYGAPTVPLDFR